MRNALRASFELFRRGKRSKKIQKDQNSKEKRRFESLSAFEEKLEGPATACVKRFFTALLKERVDEMKGWKSFSCSFCPGVVWEDLKPLLQEFAGVELRKLAKGNRELRKKSFFEARPS